MPKTRDDSRKTADGRRSGQGDQPAVPSPAPAARRPRRRVVGGAGPERIWGTELMGPIIHMTSTEAKNGFGRVLDTVARNGTVLITKHNTEQAVVMSFERYQALTQTASPDLDLLTAEFDDLVRGMQTPEVKDAVRAAFWASPEELSRAAVAAAQRESK